MSGEAIGQAVACLMILIFPAFLYLGSKIKAPSVTGVGTMFMREKKRGKSRAQLEDDLHREYGAQPRNTSQVARWARMDAREAKQDAANYNKNIRGVTAWSMSDTYISAEGHEVDIATNQIVRHNVSSRRK